MKVKSSIYIDETLRDLAGKLGINVSEAVEEILKVKIAAKFQSLETDIKSLEALGARYFAEDRKNTESLELIKQQMEFEEWKGKRQEIINTENQQIALKLFREVCQSHHIQESDLADYIMGETDTLPYGAALEEVLINKLKDAGLPADLNILRPALIKIPVRL